VVGDPAEGPNWKEEMDQQRSPTENWALLYSEFDSWDYRIKKSKRQKRKRQ